MLSVRLKRQTVLDINAGAEISAIIGYQQIELGIYNSAICDHAHKLKAGLPFDTFFGHDGRIVDAEMFRLVRTLARYGLVEYPVTDLAASEHLAIVEPQVADYWPRFAVVRSRDTLQLSRFAYLRRRDDALVLESPLSGALFVVCRPELAVTLASLSRSHEVKELCRTVDNAEMNFLALLCESRVLVLNAKSRGLNLQMSEDDGDLLLWDFHDLLFHTRSTEGRNTDPVGATYVHAQSLMPAPAVRPPWPGKKIMLKRLSKTIPDLLPPIAKLMRERHSTRVFKDQSPIVLDELSRFLETTARVLARKTYNFELGPPGSLMTSTIRPYPSAGGSYELELYLTVGKCDGLQNGFYHYDAGSHALVPIKAREKDGEEMLARSAMAMGATVPPQVLITIAARFARVSWKYSSTAYALILKDAGVLTQTLYLAATELGLGGCAIGISNIDLFAKMTGLEFYVEGPVGQFALGRPTDASDASV